MDDHATTGASSGKRIYYLRILAMYVCLAACVLGTVLWQKSYSHHAVLIKFDADGERIMNSRVTSIAGQVSIFVTNDTSWSITDWNFLSLVADSESKAMAAQVKAQQGWLGFSTRRGYLGRPKRTVTFPHWAFCLTVAFIALLFKPAPRFKVSLPGLIISMSIFAVGVATIEMLPRIGELLMNDSLSIRLMDSGEYVCDNPSVEVLRRMLESKRPSPDSFFILEIAEQEYLQGFLTPKGFILQFREGGPDAHFEVQDHLALDEAIEISDAYVRRDEDWKELCKWKQVYY